LDVVKMTLSALAGYAVQSFLDSGFEKGSEIFVLVTVIAGGVVGIDRFRASAERALNRRLAVTYQDMQDRLERHLDYVHGTVSFVPDGRGQNNDPGGAGPGYDVATAAVRRAEHRIYVVGDYSPPSEQGAPLDLPAHRSDYLIAIEDMLRRRLGQNGTQHGPSPLRYWRFIQRPKEMYEEIRARQGREPGVVLYRSDMVGDIQAFEHCERVLRIAREAPQTTSPRIDVQIRVIPFLPNCPSMLLVDDRDLQFTIPTRIDQPGDTYARQGLHGILVMEDKARGSQFTLHFEDLFRRLSLDSAPVIGIGEEESGQ
jgi:hypothetical protein